jgi:hypothetical protein
VRDILRNRAIRRIEIAWTAGTAADWAFLVVLLVVAYDAGGTLAVGILGAVRVLPAIVAAPFATSLVGRFRGDRVLTAINVLRCLGAIATAVVVSADLPVEITYVLAGIVAGAGSLVRPIQNALLPALARTPGELVASNVASSLGEGLGTFAGPLLAGALVASTGSVEASVIVAGVFAGAAAAVTGVRFEGDTDARGGARGSAGAHTQLREIPRVLRRYPAASLVVGDFVAQVFVRGVFIALTVAVSIELLDLGDGGVGMLNAAVGLGGLAGALGSLRLAGGGRLGSVFVVALAAWGLPLVAIGAWPVAAIALAGLFVTGVSNAILDVSGFTLVQRGVGNEDRVTMFAAMEALFGVGLLTGSLAAPALDAFVGTRGALVVAGALLPLCALLTGRTIRKTSGRGPTSEEHFDLLRSNELFAPLPLTALDRLSEGMTLRSFEPGEVVMRKGDPGDHYLLIAEGRLDVTDGEHALATLGPGDGAGEIALLRAVPRTATATAATHVAAYTIDAPVFLEAVAGPAAAAACERLVTSRIERSRVAG